MAGYGTAAAQRRSLHRLCHAHPRSKDRRSCAAACAFARLLLHRRARLEENARPARRAPQVAGGERRGARAHSRADRPSHRRGVAGRNRGGDHGRDHGAPAPRTGGGVIKFGPVPLNQAEGGIAVHSIRKAGLVLKKGTLIGKAEIAALEAAGIPELTVARLEPGDVTEDTAAGDIAAAVAGEGVHVDRAFTGRANLFAESAGVLVVDRAAVDALNRVDPAITFATLPAFAPVVAGKMIATVKIIPFAVAKTAYDAALAAAEKARPLVRVAPYRIRRLGIVSTV